MESESTAVVVKPESRPGRPSKKTEPKVRILLDAIERAIPLNLACDHARIGRTTFYDWMKVDDDFRTQVAYARSKAVGELVREVRKRDPWKILKNIAPEEFKDSVEAPTQAPILTIVTMSGKRIELKR